MASTEYHLKPLFQRLIDGTIERDELARLIQISRTLVQAHLQHIRSSISYLCTNQGLTITDLSYDCVADAFSRDDDNRFVKLENFIGSL